MLTKHRLRASYRVLIWAILFVAMAAVGRAQGVSAVIRANGRLMNTRDTLQICIGTSVTYQSAAQFYDQIAWRFKRGNPSVSVNTQEVVQYNSAGIDSTVLTAIGNNDTAITYIFVKVNDQKPKAAFTFSPNGECGNIPVVFNSSTSLGTNLTYRWTFNDGGTSSSPNPSYQFLNATGSSGTQTYSVKLAVTNNLNCSDSISIPVTVKRIPDAQLGNPDYPEVDVINYQGVSTFRRCVNTPSYAFKFRNASTTTAINTKYTIQWGDNSPDSVFTSWPSTTIITHHYTIGQHFLNLIVEGSTGCIGIKKYNIFLGTNPAGGFASPGNTNICSPNSLSFIISGYQNNAPGTSYTIVTNDGTPAAAFQHPPPDTVSHFFEQGSCGNVSSNGFQTYSNAFSSTLIIQNPCDATSIGVIPIYVSGKPKASIYIPTPNLCTNYQLYISNLSTAGGVITTLGGGSSSCSYNMKQVWTISPSTGYTLTTGTLGSTNGSPANSINWSGGSSYLYANFTTPGNYTIKLYVANDRCGVDSISRVICVRNPPRASFTLAKTSGCAPDSVAVTNTSPTGGCLGDSYKWEVFHTDPQNCGSSSPTLFVGGTTATSKNVVIKFQSAGRYIIRLTVTSNGTSTTCPPATFQDTFWVKTKPKVEINPINAVCIGNAIAPTSTVSNCYADSTVRYAWTFTGGVPSSSTLPVPGNVTYASIGQFQVVLNAGNECGVSSDTTSAIITSTPTVEAGVDRSACSGEQVQLGGSPSPGLTYRWTPSTGLSNPNIANPVLSFVYSGTASDTTIRYTVTGSSGVNCSGTDSVVVIIRRKPIVSVAPLSSVVCAGQSSQLVARGADSYTWSPPGGLNVTNEDTVVATPSATTLYTVTGLLANGCSTDATATVSVTPYPIVEAGVDSFVCNNSTAVQFTGTPAGGTWSGHPALTSTGLFNPSVAGNGLYFLKYTATNNTCSKTDSIGITVSDPPVANAGMDTVVCQSATPLVLAGKPAGGRWSGSTAVTSTGSFSPVVAGTYNLIYTVGGGSCVDTDTVIITVAGGIINNTISSNQAVCTGRQPSAITGSTVSGGNGNPVYQWESSHDSLTWTPVSGAVAKDYAPGVLTATTWFRRVASTVLCFGAESNVSLPVRITVNPDATAAFTPTVPVGCTPFTLDEAVINLTRHPESVGEYRWFANGNVLGSGDAFPGYTMNVPGDSVTIMLIAGSRFGCLNDTLEYQFRTVESPLPAFTLSDTIGCGPLAISVVNTTPQMDRYKYLWNFGQGERADVAQPGLINFPVNPANGDTTYMVSLKTYSVCDTIAAVHSVVVRSKPKVLFTPDKTEGCSPMRVVLTNTSRGSNATYSWDFGDGSPAVPAISPSVSHTFNVGIKDTFFVKLQGGNDCGSDSLRYAIVVNPNAIRIDFAVNGNERFGCAPHSVRFINNTTGANTFAWDFGDGNTLNTTKGIDTVLHTFTTPGNYTINLLAANGCNDTSDIEQITVEVKPKVSFVAGPLLTCVTDTITFTNNSDGGIVNNWQFGDMTTSSLREPRKVYTQPGSYHAVLVGSRSFPQGFSCSDSAFADIVIRDTIAGDFSASSLVGNCVPFTPTFANLSPNSVQTTWNFGDGSGASGESTGHTYTAPGTYEVTMISKERSGCTYKAVKTITVRAPAGELLYTGGFVCQGNAVRLEARATNAGSYRFVFGDGDSSTTANTAIFHTYNSPGVYVPHAYLIEGNCLIKVATGDTIKVEEMKAGFSPGFQYTCGSTRVNLSDTSRAFFGLKSWEWNFEDGTISSTKDPVKVFTSRGTYPITLSVVANSGCTASTSVNVDVEIRNYPVTTIRGDSIGCTAQPFVLAAEVITNDGISNYSWDFGNNVKGSGINTAPVYNTSGIYTIRLVTPTIYGCADTAFKTIVIRASPIVNAGSDVLICRGQSVQLRGLGAIAWQWAPIEGLSCVSCSNPVASPQASTLYVATGTNAVGCSVADSVLVQVIQPFELTISPNDTICIGGQTQLFASGASTYLWQPAAGLSSASAPNPIANPAVTTQYTLVGKDAFNCFADTATVLVAVGRFPTVDLGTGGLLVAGTQVPMNPIFTNGPFSRYTWTPDVNLSCNNCPQPVATINNNITYTLEAENVFGCVGSDTINYSVTCDQSMQLFLPNAFSPDGDGLNDVFMVRGKGIASIKYFRVFNRWGQLVFDRSNTSANDPLQGWDGRVNGKPANPDVYVYTTEVTCTAGGSFIKNGNVTLFR